MDERLVQRLGSQLSQASPVLFLGAGFSIGAPTKAGTVVPSVPELTKLLWAAAFPTEDYEESALADVYEAGVRTAGNTTKQVMREALDVDPGQLPAWYERWFSLPWHRVYTLNVDTLAEAADTAFQLPRTIRGISALADGVPAAEGADVLDVVHLNGSLGDLPDVTFSERQYGERGRRPDLWYETLARDLKLHPVVFVGTTLGEPSLWTYVEGRGPKPSAREIRPGSYLVTPTLGRAREVALSGFNVDLVTATAEAFADGVLADMEEDSKRGHGVLSRRARGGDSGPIWMDLGDVINDSEGDAREFLLGREPRWSDLTEGFAISRRFDDELDRVFVDESPRVLVVAGTAGSGKSTSAMRFALSRMAAGDRVRVFNRDSHARLRDIRKSVGMGSADVFLLDDLGRFGRAGGELLEDMADENPDAVIVGCIRSGQLEGFENYLPGRVAATEAVVPHLEESDVQGLLDALDNANRLGVLKGRSRDEQTRVVEERFGKQLLVALIEVTSGQRFHETVESECREFSGAGASAYACAAVATKEFASLTDEELVVACGEDAGEAMAAIDRLLARHLLVRDTAGRIAVRHQVIADHAVTYYRDQGVLPGIVVGLIVSMGASARPGNLRKSRAGRLLIRLLSHDWLVRRVFRKGGKGTDVSDVRSIYQAVENALSGDYHYWLQRGSFETEAGDVNFAKNCLDQALSMAPEDLNVRTQWSYMSLKRASRYPTDSGAVSDVDQAFLDLDDVIEIRGKEDFYPFHVYGSQGLAWSRRGPLSRDDRRKLLEHLQGVVDSGLRNHPSSEQLKKLGRDLKGDYLGLAVEEED